MSLSVIVPNYNGSELLRQYLPSVLDEASRTGCDSVTVVDDASTDNSLDALKSISSEITIVSQERNAGFGETVNNGVAQTKSEFAAVCMTDMQIEPGTFGRTMEAMSDPNVFAAGFHIKVHETAGNAGITCLPYARGLFHTEFPDDSASTDAGSPVNIAFAVGGAMIVRTKMFRALGGFDKVYAPYCWEDVDLSWRAWRMGWKSVNVPGALAWHRHPHRTLDNQADKDKVERIVMRNRLTFVRRNITDGRTKLDHAFWMLLMTAKATALGKSVLKDASRESRAALKTSSPPVLPEGEKIPDRVLMDYLARPHPIDEIPKA